MKRILFIFILFSFRTSAQVIVDSVNLNDVPGLEFIQILGFNEGFFKKKLVVVVDFGQKYPMGQDSRVTKDGDVKVFQTMIQALNFFYNNGWDLETSYLLTIPGSGHVYHHLMRRRK